MTRLAIGSLTEEVPTLLSFPQGVPSKGVSLRVGRKGSGRKRKHMVVGEANGVPGLTYQGTDFGSQSTKKDSCKYAIGVYHKDTDTLHLLPADHAYLMRAGASAWAGGEMGETSTSIANYERSKSLTQVFGTVKKQRAVKANAAKIVKGDNVQGVGAVESAMKTEIKDELDDADGAILMLDGAGQSIEDHRKSMLPSFDQDATAAKKIYDLNDIVPKNIQAALEKMQTSVEKDFTGAADGEDSDVHRQWSAFFRDTCGGFQVVVDIHAESADQIAAAGGDARDRAKKEGRMTTLRSRLLYLSGLMMMYLDVAAAYNFRAERGPIVDKCEKFLPGVAQLHMFKKFTQMRNNRKVSLTDGSSAGALECTQRELDRILLHIFVLVVTLNKFSVDLGTVATDLKLSLKRANLLVREIGCKITKPKLPATETLPERTVMRAGLEAPLKFPKRWRGPERK